MNIFDVLNRGDSRLYEPSMSAMLGYLLDSSENHGLGSAFVKMFLEEVKQALLTIKRECTKQDDCEGCPISKVLGYSCQEVAIPEEWEV